ncbi:MAG: hypothetical protein MI919_26485 [Holophagales bacterium]|nr:hypothetical protein [Holophagales bacterium]
MRIDLDLEALRVESFETLPELREEEARMVVGGTSCCSSCTCDTGDTVVIVADKIPCQVTNG